MGGLSGPATPLCEVSANLPTGTDRVSLGAVSFWGNTVTVPSSTRRLEIAMSAAGVGCEDDCDVVAGIFSRRRGFSTKIGEVELGRTNELSAEKSVVEM